MRSQEIKDYTNVTLINIQKLTPNGKLNHIEMTQIGIFVILSELATQFAIFNERAREARS